MPKRGENIYKRKDGRWEGRISKGTESGRRVYQSVYGKSYREVKDKITEIRLKTEIGGRNGQTLAEASEIWVQSQSEYWKESTIAAYRQMLSKYIIPHMGGRPVAWITNQELLEFVTEINQQKEKPLSRNYMFQICAMIRRVMIFVNKQYDSGIAIPVNPVKKEQGRKLILPSDTTLKILEEYLHAHSEQDTCIGILIALHTGIRVGELSALMWKDIDLKEEYLYIRRNMVRVHNKAGKKNKGGVTRVISQKPKSADSERIIPLPPCLISVLKKHRKEDSCHVIGGVKAAWAEPRTIQYRFKSILKKCGIESFNIHMLRHAFATRCVSRGLDIKSLSEILGHSSIQLTLNLYVHSTIQQKRLLMQQYDAAIH